jgi:hypothetical protein
MTLPAMPRISNWPRALADYVAANQHKAFAWGKQDCIMFACGAIEAITGKDPAHHWRGQYASALGAARIFRNWGGFEEMVSTIAGAEGFDEQPVAMARRGELVLLQKRWPNSGVCLGMWSAFAGKNNIVMVKTAECYRSWRVA